MSHMQQGLMKALFLSLALSGLLLGMPGRMLLAETSTITVPTGAQSRHAVCTLCENMTEGSGTYHHGEGHMGSAHCYASGGCAAYATSSRPYLALLVLPRGSLPVGPHQNEGRVLFGPNPRPPDTQLLA